MILSVLQVKCYDNVLDYDDDDDDDDDIVNAMCRAASYNSYGKNHVFQFNTPKFSEKSLTFFTSNNSFTPNISSKSYLLIYTPLTKKKFLCSLRPEYLKP